MRKIQSWLKLNWPVATPFLAVYSLVVLLIYRAQLDFALFLIWLQIPVYFLHQFEEYIFPGGFLAYFNRNILMSDRDDFPLTINAAFWINVPVIFIAYPVSAILAAEFGVGVALWVAYFSIINAASHIVMYLQKGYNPGFYVSLVLNIPVGVLTLGYVVANDLASPLAHAAGLLVALVIQGGLMVYGFLILKPKIYNN